MQLGVPREPYVILFYRRARWLTDGFVQVYEFCGGSRRIDLYKKTGDVATPVQGPVYPPAGAKLTQVFTA